MGVVSVDDAAQVRLLNGGSGPALGRVEAGAVSIDGVRTLAWENAEGTHVGRVDGLPLTAPRLLAAHDADVVRRGQRWRPQFDFTAAVVAGVVEVCTTRPARWCRACPRRRLPKDPFAV